MRVLPAKLPRECRAGKLSFPAATSSRRVCRFRNDPLPSLATAGNTVTDAGPILTQRPHIRKVRECMGHPPLTWGTPSYFRPRCGPPPDALENREVGCRASDTGGLASFIASAACLPSLLQYPFAATLYSLPPLFTLCRHSSRSRETRDCGDGISIPGGTVPVVRRECPRSPQGSRVILRQLGVGVRELSA